MSLNEILGSAASGLAASQAGLRSVSNNIANVGTPGYARERVTLSTGVTSGRVNGVVVGEPERVADRFLEATVYRRSGDMGRTEVTANYLDRLQALLGEPGADFGLPARLDAIAKSAIEMTSVQSSAETAAVFVGSVEDAITSLSQLDEDVNSLRADVESEVVYSVDRINSLLVRIHDLNDTISRMDGLGRSSVGSADQRLSAIEELSSLINVTVREQPDGRVSIDAANGAALLDRRLRQLSYASSGAGSSQPVYPTIDIKFADGPDEHGASTGEKLDSPAIGGKLGGLLDLRDHQLPEFTEQVGVLFSGLAETLNAASNASTTVPAPVRLEGRETGLVGADRLGFTGSAVFAVTSANGTLVAKTSVDLSAMATVDDAVAAINAGLGGAATATFTDGRLVIQATGTGNGVAIGEGSPASDRAGMGFSHYFGMNDLIRSETSALTPTGFEAGDPHGFGAGETADIVLRDGTGRVLSRYSLTGSGGPTYGDLVDELNASPLGGFGSFSMDDRGRMRFEPSLAITGASLSIPSDSTDRFGTGRSFSALSGLSGEASGLSEAGVRPDVLGSAAKLPLAKLNTAAAVGEKAIGAGDISGATEFVDRLGKAVDLGKDGVVNMDRFSSLLLGRAGTEAAQAESSLADAAARKNDAVNRRDSFSGVNIDEELAQMVVLQNSYSAAARVMTTAKDMYDILLGMMN